MNAVITDRSKWLGGTDAAAVMGLSPWATPVELWQQKTGRVEKPEPDAAQLKRWARGHKLEPFIREMAIDKLQALGLEVEMVATNQRYVDPEYDFLSCEIDFELKLTGYVTIGDRQVLFDGEHINADAKSVTGFARKKWGDVDTEDVPIEYAAQFMHGIMVTGRSYCLVAALRSFDDVDIFWTVRDDETIAAMRPKLVSFWVDHVLADVPPDPMVFDDIKALFPLDDGSPVEASIEMAALVTRLTEVKKQIKSLEIEEEVLKFEVANAISPHAILQFGGKPIATWKAQNDTRLDQGLLKVEQPQLFEKYQRTKTIRVLRLPSPKKG